MDQEGQIRRFSKICNSTSLLDRSSCEFGLHELYICTIIVLLLFVLCLGERGCRSSILRVVDTGASTCTRGIVSRRAFIDRFAAVTARVSSRTFIIPRQPYLSESFALPAAVFFRFGVGILHSMENATQFVHGTPRLAASQRTYSRQPSCACTARHLKYEHDRRPQHVAFWRIIGYLSCMTGLFR